MLDSAAALHGSGSPLSPPESPLEDCHRPAEGAAADAAGPAPHAQITQEQRAAEVERIVSVPKPALSPQEEGAEASAAAAASAAAGEISPEEELEGGSLEAKLRWARAVLRLPDDCGVGLGNAVRLSALSPLPSACACHVAVHRACRETGRI